MFGTTLHSAFTSGAAAYRMGLPGVENAEDIAYVVVSSQTTRDDGESTWLVYDVTHGATSWAAAGLSHSECQAYETLAKAAMAAFDAVVV